MSGVLFELEPLDLLRTRLTARPLGTAGGGAGTYGALESLLDFEVRIADGPNYFMLVKDIFHRRIYHFDSARPAPMILDGGSNIGLSVLYFKYAYPQARIIAFEPDREVLPILRENLERNKLEGVQIVEAALHTRAGHAAWHTAQDFDGALAEYAGPQAPAGTHQPGAGGAPTGVATVRLHDYLEGPIDFLKLNIEGAEVDVLADCGDRLRQVQALSVEYHHLPGLRRRLHELLALLDGQGFDYLIHDYDRETNPKCQPPFRLRSDSRYYLLIHAVRRESGHAR